MSIFDSHCHPQFPTYDQDRAEMIKRNLDAGVFMIAVGTNLEDSKQGIELAEKYDGIWATVGLHPNDLDELRIKNYELRDFEELLKNPRVVAVGEIGLDYYRTTEPEKQEKQKEIFREFIRLAHKFEKPIVIHSRDSQTGSTGRVHKDILEILDSEQNLHHGGVVHSFTGNIEELRKYLNKGLYIGFNGIITFAKQYDEMILEVPLDRMLIETDAPFLAPVPYRGQRNEPRYVVEVANRIAELKNSTPETVLNQTAENCKKLFKIS